MLAGGDVFRKCAVPQYTVVTKGYPRPWPEGVSVPEALCGMDGGPTLANLVGRKQGGREGVCRRD